MHAREGTGRILDAMRIAFFLAAAALLPAACSNPGRPRAPERALVVYEPGRAEDATRMEELLRVGGFDAQSVAAGMAARTTSTVAVYGLRLDPGRLERVEALVAPFGELEILPFHTPGDSGTAVVVWLCREEQR